MFQLVEPGSLDLMLQAVALAVIVFDADQKVEAILERGTSFILGLSICVIKASDIEVSRISISLSIAF